MRGETLASRLLLFVAAAVFLWAAVPYSYLPFAGEHGLFSYGAWRFAQGDVLYRDFNCNDAGGIYLLHWLAHALFGWTMPALRELDLLWTAATLALLHGIARALLGRLAASLGVLFAVLAYFSLGYQATAQRDGFTLLPFLLALRLALGWGAGGRRDDLRAFAIGLLVAAIFWIKPPLGALGVVFLLAPSGGASGAGGRLAVRARRTLWMGVAFALPALGWLAYFAANHALGPAGECLFLYHLRYAGVRYGLGEQLVQVLRHAFAHPVYFGGIVGLVAGSFDRRLRLLAAGSWAYVALVALQGKLLGYHMVPTHLLLCVWCAALVARGLRAGGRAWSPRAGGAPPGPAPSAAARLASAAAGVAAAALALWVLAGATAALGRARYGEIWSLRLSGQPVQLEREEAKVARFLAEQTAPSESVLVWGVGQPPMIHFMAKRRAPTRFLMNYVFSSFDPEEPLLRRWREEYLQILRADPPRYVVVIGGDEYAAIRNLDSRQALERFSELRDFVREGYTKVGEMRGRVVYEIYERRPAGERRAP